MQQGLKVYCFESIVLLFRHCSVQKIRPEFLKTWFLKGGTLAKETSHALINSLSVIQCRNV